MHKLIKEFKEFAIKGNAVELAIGIVIGTAFGSITNSLVKDIIMPPLGFILGKVDFSGLVIPLGESVTINYGLFINTLINFIIIALAMFFVVKQMNTIRRNIDKMEKSGLVEEPKEKICPFCKKSIAIDATRCPFCTSEIK